MIISCVYWSVLVHVHKAMHISTPLPKHRHAWIHILSLIYQPLSFMVGWAWGLYLPALCSQVKGSPCLDQNCFIPCSSLNPQEWVDMLTIFGAASCEDHTLVHYLQSEKAQRVASTGVWRLLTCFVLWTYIFPGTLLGGVASRGRIQGVMTSWTLCRINHLPYYSQHLEMF